MDNMWIHGSDYWLCLRALPAWCFTCICLGYINAFAVYFFSPQEAEAGFVPSVQDFDKKLAEADAYLQILIDQLKVGRHVETPHVTSSVLLV